MASEREIRIEQLQQVGVKERLVKRANRRGRVINFNVAEFAGADLYEQRGDKGRAKVTPWLRSIPSISVLERTAAVSGVPPPNNG